MKNFLIIMVSLILLVCPSKALAASGIVASSGGTHAVGESFTISVTASGTSFDSLQGIISVSGPVDIISFSPGDATWLPGKTPANGKQFVGITTNQTSLKVASIELKGNAAGSGQISVNAAKLAYKGNIVGTSSVGTNFIIGDKIDVTSLTHPDQEKDYETTTVDLSWDKADNVQGFNYLLDESAETDPDTQLSQETSVEYKDLTIGTHYFHIKAKKSSGWGPITHFKINIKDPDPKVGSLAKPYNISIKKSANFINNVDNGTITGIIISGFAQPNFTANLEMWPTPELPEGKIFSVKTDSKGYFEYKIDFPIKSGFYKLAIQGQQDKILTPKSDEIKLEISQAHGGSIRILKSSDTYFKWYNTLTWLDWLLIGMIILILLVTLFILLKRNSLFSFFVKEKNKYYNNRQMDEK